MLLRHLVSIALLPFTVTVVVPIWIARSYGVSLLTAGSTGAVMAQAAGLLVCALGLLLFAWSGSHTFVNPLFDGLACLPAPGLKNVR
jgi:hypothetical protein